MRRMIQLLAAVAIMAAAQQVARADGMIVPIRPDLRVRGSWAVKYHHVTIRVRDQVASVSIDQQFVNTGDLPIEVEYFFPVPPGAAIDSMTMIVDGMEYSAQLLKASEARKIYEEIVRKKKDPALLEYAGFGLYRTRAFPLVPGKPVKVVVTYKCICRKDSETVEVWYPLNTEKFSAKPIEDVWVKVDIKAAADITNVYSPTHEVKVDRKGPRHIVAIYEDKNVLPTTDLQVFYKSADEDVAATLLTYWPKDEHHGYFLLLVSPNPQVGDTKVVPKDIVLVLDRSGSMGGKKIEQAREALEFVLKNLNAEDHFNVIAYDDSVEAFFDELQPASQEKVEAALELLDRIDAKGGTNIHDALQEAMGQFPAPAEGAKAARARASYIIFLTDGVPTVGETKEPKIIDAAKAANKTDARLFAFGVGYDVNVRLLDKLVAANGGRSEYVKPAEPIESKVSALYRKIKDPVMTNLAAELKMLSLRDIYPRQLGDLFGGDQIVAVGRYDAAKVRHIDGQSMQTTLIVRGQYEGRERAFEYPATVRGTGRGGHEFVAKLWATRRIGWLLDQIQLSGESNEIIDELVRLSKKYGIITPYTSFLAKEVTDLTSVDELRRLGLENAQMLRRQITGGAGQVHATNRMSLNRAARAAPASRGGYLYQTGFASEDEYEADKKVVIKTVRQVGNQALYRRGQTWIAANATDVDLDRAAGNIQTIERFSKEYFQLALGNSIWENQILASQNVDEELVIRLRGQLYRIR